MRVKVIKICKLKRAFHSSTRIGELTYIFGGVPAFQTGHDPYRDLITFNMETNIYKTIRSEQPFARSHHAAAAIDHWLIVVGGWDAEKRTNGVVAFDTLRLEWCALEPTDKNKPPAGLSGHTLTFWKEEVNEKRVKEHHYIITGVEYGVRYQRSTGIVYKLIVDMACKKYHFSEMSQFEISARVEHTVHLVKAKRGKTNLVMYGGQDSTRIEILKDFKIERPEPETEELQEYMTKYVESSSREWQQCGPVPLRYHSSLSGTIHGMFYGGEVYNKVRDAISPALYLHNADCTKFWCNLSIIDPAFKRMGHTMNYYKGKLFLIGGICKDDKVCKDEKAALASPEVIVIDLNMLTY